MGLLADRLGKKRVLIWGLLGLPVTLLVFAFTTELPTLLVASAGGGMAEGALLASWNALIADQTDAGNRTPAFVLSFIINALMGGVGMALPFIFPWLESFTGLSSAAVHSAAFIIVASIVILSAIALWHVLRNYHEMHKKVFALTPGKSRRNLIKFTLPTCLLGLGAGFIIPLVPTWLFLKYAIPDTFSGPLLALSGITMALASIGCSALAMYYGSVRAIVLTEGFSTVFMVAIPFVPGAALAATLYLARSTLMNMAGPLSDSFMMGVIAPEDRGLASAVDALVWRIPNSITTVVGGMMLASGDYSTPFLLAGGFYVVSIIMFFLFFKDFKTSV
jgi:predicted MFS family arabinose efflux permease